MDNALLILKAGSSSLKFAVYEADAAGTLQAGYRGEEIGRHGRFQVFHAPDAGGLTDHAVAAADHEEALQRLLDWLETRHPGLEFCAAGHRVVHGGADFSRPVDEQVLAAAEPPFRPARRPRPQGALRQCGRPVTRRRATPDP